MEGQHHGREAQSPPQHQPIPLESGPSPTGYSNLEVAPQDNARSEPGVYYNPAPEPVPGGYYDPGKELFSPSNAFPSPAGYVSSYQPPGPSNSGSGAAYQPMGPPADETPKATVTMKKKTLCIVVAVAVLVVIGAVVGGAVGGTLSSRNRNSQADGAGGSPTDGSSNGIVLRSSAISALAYTISGTNYRIIFWQPSAASSEIVYSLWDSANNSWEVVKLQSRLGGSAAVEAKPGTALSAVARPMLGDEASLSLSIFYLSASNAVQELRTQDARGASWSKQTHTITATNVSQLAAIWDVCNNTVCSGELGLAYESYENDMSKQVMYWPNAIPGSSNRTTRGWQKITSGSGIAMAMLSRGRITIYAESAAGNLTEVSGWSDVNGKPSWSITQNGFVGNLPTDKPPSISAVGLGGPMYPFVVIRYRDGSLQALYSNGLSWCQPAEPVTRNTPSGLGKKFNAVSATTDLRIYSLAPDGNAIHVFTADPNDPLTWTYDGEVKLN